LNLSVLSRSIMERDLLTSKIIGAGIEVHRHLGPGLLESTYQRSLSFELDSRGLRVKAEKYLPVLYKTLEIKDGYRIDLLVEDSVIVEIKAVERILDVHRAQILTYLKMANLKTGLLINFNVPLLKHGIERFVL